MKHNLLRHTLIIVITSTLAILNPLKSFTQACDITSGLIHEYKFDGNMQDNIGSNNLSNSVTYTEDRYRAENKAAKLEALNQTIMLNNTIPVNSATNISLSFWIKTPNFYLGASWGYFGHNTAGNTFMGIYGDNPTTPEPDGCFGLYNTTQGVVMPNGVKTKFNTWYHVAFVKNADTVSLYINGSFQCKAQINSLSMSEIKHLTGRGIGNTTLPGTYDDYRIYNRVLTAGEVDTLYSLSYKPYFSANPISVNLCASNDRSYIEAPTEFEEYQFQWLKNGTPIIGENMKRLYFHSPNMSDAGNYSVVMSNSCNLSDTSQTIPVTYGSGPNYSTNQVYAFLFGGAINGFTYLSPGVGTNANSAVSRFGGANHGAVHVVNKSGGMSLNTPFNDTSSTISLWYRYDQAGNSNLTYLLGAPAIANTNNASFSPMGISTNNELGIISTGGTGGFWGSGVYLTHNTWYHIAVVINSNVCKMYVNGTLVKTFTNLQLLTNYPITYIANTGQGVVAPYRGAMGMLDDIRIYSTSQNDQAIYDLYSEYLVDVPISTLNLCKGARATFKVNSLTNNPNTTFTYRWKSGSNYLENNQRYFGTDQAEMYIENAIASDAGTYTCEVINNQNCMVFLSSPILLNINTSDTISIDITPTQPTCTNALGSVVVNATNATEVSILTNGLISSTITAANLPYTHNNLAAPNTYTYSASNINTGCMSRKSFTVGAPGLSNKVYSNDGNFQCSEGPTSVVAIACNVSGNQWINLYDQVNGQIIGAINPNGQNLGNITMTMYNEINNQNSINANTDLTQFPVKYMHKSYSIISSVAPSSNVQIRFFYQDRDLNLIKQATSCSNCTFADLIMSHVSNVTSDCDATNNSGSSLKLYWSKNSANTNNETQIIQSYLQSPASAMYGNLSLNTPGGCNSAGSLYGARYFEINTNSFSEFRLHMMPNLPLPVNGLSFDVSLVNDKSELEWSTLSEQNTSHFEIEKSNNALTWSVIGNVDASGNSHSKTTYRFTDEKPGIGKTYYRIKVLDIDGNVEYSLVKDVYRTATGSITLFPNPSEGELNIHLQKVSLPATLQVLAMDGKVITHRILDTEKHKLELSELASGLYLIKIIDHVGTLYVDKFNKK